MFTPTLLMFVNPTLSSKDLHSKTIDAVGSLVSSFGDRPEALHRSEGQHVVNKMDDIALSMRKSMQER